MPLQLQPTVQQSLQPAQDVPEWARVLTSLLPALSPTGATGAALSMTPQAPPQSTWGQLAMLAPIALGALATLKGPEGEGSLAGFKRLFMERGGVESGAGRAVASPRTAQEFAQTGQAMRGLSQAEMIRATQALRVSPERVKAWEPVVQRWGLSPEHGEALAGSVLEPWQMDAYMERNPQSGPLHLRSYLDSTYNVPATGEYLSKAYQHYGGLPEAPPIEALMKADYVEPAGEGMYQFTPRAHDALLQGFLREE